jgi:hypothetical protein
MRGKMKIELYGKTYEWDEEIKSETHNISTKKLCLVHNFINASLHWSKKVPSGEYHISLQNDEEIRRFGPSWGGRGGIRFCKNCKEIDCIHIWEDDKEKDESWKTCDHSWGGGLTRSDNDNGAQWWCYKCGAVYRLMCSHGGSMYVCNSCYKATMNNMAKEEGTVENYLSKHCWSEGIPTIKTCTICKRKIRIM